MGILAGDTAFGGVTADASLKEAPGSTGWCIWDLSCGGGGSADTNPKCVLARGRPVSELNLPIADLEAEAVREAVAEVVSIIERRNVRDFCAITQREVSLPSPSHSH